MSIHPVVTALRSVGAVILGYAVIVVGAIVFQDALFGGVNYGSPLLALVVGGGMTAVSAVAGGYLLAQVAPAAPWWHATPLVLWLCTETTILYLRGTSPLWFDVVTGGSLVVGVLLGVYLWVRRNADADRSDAISAATSGR